VPAGGELTPHSIDILLSRGIRYQAQCSGDDIPYWWQIDGRPCGLLEVPTHWSIDDAPQFLYTLIPQMGAIKPADQVFTMWKDDFDAFRHFGRCMVLQMHPQWIGRPARVRMLERLIAYMKSFDDVWWATGREIVDYWSERYPAEVEASGEEAGA
jgi:peptidoglycan/xylan/chitin deacetylase (PgdA/CDA1 family)